MAAIATLTDDFQSSFNTSKWTSFTNSGSASVSNVSGRARVAHDYATDLDKTGFYSASNYEFAGSSMYWRLYPPQASAEAFKLTTQVGVVHSNLTFKEGVGFKFQNTSLQFLIWNNFDDEWQVEAAAAATYSSVDHAWLRVRESASTFYWDTAPDNNGVPGAWTQRASYSRTGTNVSFDDMAGFMGTGGAKAYFRVYHNDATFPPANLTSHLEIDGVNGALVQSVTHATDGALRASQGAQTGSAQHNVPHATDGALRASQGAQTGSSVHNIPHATDGALAGSAGTTEGAARIGPLAVVHSTSGTLQARPGRVGQPPAASGALPASGGVLTGRASNITPGAVESLQDAFDADTVDSGAGGLWDVTAPAGSSVSQADGKLVLAINALDGNPYCRLTAKNAKNLTGSRAYARLSSAVVVANNQGGIETGLQVLLDESNVFSWVQVSDGTIQAQKKVAGSTTDNVILSYTPATHAWIAVSERGGTVYWESAPSTAQDPPLESEWVTRYSAAPGFAITGVKVRLIAGVFNGAQSGLPTQQAKFDSINTQTRAPAAHATTGALAGSMLPGLGLAAKKVSHVASGALVAALAVGGAQARRYFDHPTSGALVGSSAIMSGSGSTSDVTRKLWVDAQDTGGAWTNPPSSPDDPWTARPDSSVSWGT